MKIHAIVSCKKYFNVAHLNEFQEEEGKWERGEGERETGEEGEGGRTIGKERERDRERIKMQISLTKLLLAT